MRDTLIIIICVVGASLLLFAASSRLVGIRQARTEMGLVSNISNNSLDNAPPSLAFATIAMGAFRGLVVDVLWLRADKLKEEGQFFDARQLAEWITVLQPRFADVWVFHAWNMAYNISVAVPNTQPDERWRWVRNGYELLRDKGIEKNPYSIQIYRYLAWIFQHKISGIADDCHMHYKRQLALAMKPLLGERTREEFQLLSQAPEELSDIMQDAEVGRFVELLKETDDKFSDDDEFARNYLALRQNPAQFAPEAHEVVNSFRGTETLDKFHRFARAHQLRKVWKLDIDLMIRLNDKYGATDIDDPNSRKPLNWEHPDVHAMYWAQKGLDIAGKPGVYSVDEKNTDRIIFHSLQNLFRTGKIILYDLPDKKPAVFVRPDLEMFDSLNTAWVERIEKYEAFEKGNPKAVRGGHRNMLINAVELFYHAGHRVKAARIYAELRRRYAGPEDRRFDVPLISFVRRRMADELDRVGDKDARELIEMTLREAYFRFAVRDDDEAAGLERWAREVYDMYQTETADGDRTGLPPFEFMRYMALRGFMDDVFYPDHLKLRLIGRIKIERPELFEKLMEQEETFQKLVEEATRTPQLP